MSLGYVRTRQSEGLDAGCSLGGMSSSTFLGERWCLDFAGSPLQRGGKNVTEPRLCSPFTGPVRVSPTQSPHHLLVTCPGGD